MLQSMVTGTELSLLLSCEHTQVRHSQHRVETTMTLLIEWLESVQSELPELV